MATPTSPSFSHSEKSPVMTTVITRKVGELPKGEAFEQKTKELEPAVASTIIGQEEEEILQTTLRLASESKKRNFCSKHQSGHSFYEVRMKESIECKYIHLYQPAAPENISEITSPATESILSRDQKIQILKDKYAVNEKELLTACLAHQGLQKHSATMVHDYTTHQTMESRSLMEKVLYESLHPRIHCLMAQAGIRNGLRGGLKALIEDLEGGGEKMVREREKELEKGYAWLEACKRKGCDGEWTEHCSLNEG